MHPIRTIKEKVGSALEEIAESLPQAVKDAVVTVSDKTAELNEKVLEPEEQQFADEHGYTHGGKREKVAKHLMGVDKYEAGAHFLNEHFVNPIRPHENKEDQTPSSAQPPPPPPPAST